MKSKKTVVLGASTNQSRYSFIATNKLLNHGHEVIPVGIKKGEIAGHSILNGQPEIEAVDTVTLYIGPRWQKEYYDYIRSLNPNRVVFNPGTENEELYKILSNDGIEAIEACTLVMLAANTY